VSQINQAPLTVTALTKYIKLKIDVDGNLQGLLLKGEISNLTKNIRGHLYFTLKDENTQIKANMFAGMAKNLKFEPANGMQIIVTGSVSLYEPAGTYSINITKMVEDGVGNLYVAFNQLKEKLLKQGYFESHHKKLIPKFPKAIAVITSSTGAAVKDIITTLKRRAPNVTIYLYPAIVQGDTAATDLVNRLQQVNFENRVDTIIIGRGGGSIEDLWAFNEEVVAKAIFDSNIPVISAVGHETDTTIADFVSDLRAPTPTAAAELAAPNIIEVVEFINTRQSRLTQAMSRLIEYKKNNLTRITQHYIMKNPHSLIEQRTLQLSHLETSMKNAIEKYVDQSRLRIERLDLKLVDGAKQNIKTSKNSLQILITKIEMLNPLSVLKKGYSVVTDQTGTVLTSVETLKVGDTTFTTLFDGSIQTKITDIKKNKSR